MMRKFLPLVLVGLLAACQTPPVQRDLSAFHTADPHSILVLPPVNKSPSAAASEYMLTTIPKPLANRGYYVFPVNTVKRVLEEDGLADANLVHSVEPQKLGELFGADSVLYVEIETWDATFLITTTAVTVGARYVLKDTGSGETLWENTMSHTFNTDAGGSGGGLAGLLVKVVVAAIERADPNYTFVAAQANTFAFNAPGNTIPAGPHHPSYLTEP